MEPVEDTPMGHSPRYPGQQSDMYRREGKHQLKGQTKLQLTSTQSAAPLLLLAGNKVQTMDLTRIINLQIISSPSELSRIKQARYKFISLCLKLSGECKSLRLYSRVRFDEKRGGGGKNIKPVSTSLRYYKVGFVTISDYISIK